jgi:hypothetical protein
VKKTLVRKAAVMDSYIQLCIRHRSQVKSALTLMKAATQADRKADINPIERWALSSLRLGPH